MEGIIRLILGLVWGRSNERRHIADLALREAQLRHMTLTTARTFPGGVDLGAVAVMVHGECAIGTDGYKEFTSGWRKIFGGEVRSYVTLAWRARREAILRMMMDAHTRGYNAVCNYRVECITIGSGPGNFSVTAVAYGTAYRTTAPPAPQ
jgi:uncharacterized protein YbjQ (UPF0145 family)